MQDCGSNFVASWVDIDFGSENGWQQIGMTQGTLLGNCQGTNVRIYAEQQWCTDDRSVRGQEYALWDLGHPPVPNYPVYVSRTNAAPSGIDPCNASNRTYREWAYRIGSWSSSPKAYGYVPIEAGLPYADQEVYWENVGETIGTNWWGLDNNGHASASAGLHLYRKSIGHWDLWAPCCTTTDVFVDPTLTWVPKANYYSFQVHD